MKKLILLLTAILLLQQNDIKAQVRDTTLSRLIETAVSISPKLKVLRNKQDISQTKIAQGSNLPDPVMSLGLMSLPINSFSFSEEPMTGKIVGLSQSIPFPGKLKTAKKALSKDVEINQQEIDDYTNEIASEVSKSYFDLTFLRESIRITEKNKSLLKSIAEVVRTKYTVSSTSQQNLIKVDVELSKIADKLEELRGKERAVLAVLNSWINKNPESEIVTNEVPETDGEIPTNDMLVETAQKNRPYLIGLKLAEEKAGISESLAGYDFYPNFNFTLQYTQRDKLAKTNMPLVDFLSFVVGFNLPLDYGGKTTSKVEEAKLMKESYSNQYEAAIQILNKNFGVSLATLNSLKQREKLIKEGLLPQAEQSLKAALADYQVGNTDFINVTDSQNKLYDIEINLNNIRTMYYKELAQLRFLTGAGIKNN